MSARTLPVRPDLDQLKHQAKDLLKAYRDGDAEARADFAELHPKRVGAQRAKLADAQLVLARLYGASSWTRIVQCCQLIDAIWDDDLKTVRRLVTANRNLLMEDARIVNSNWGPPMSYAANLGRDRIIRLLHELGARDLQFAMGRAVLQSRIDTATMLNEMLGKPAPPPSALDGAAYTLSVRGTEFVFARGFQIRQGAGTPVAAVIGSDSRHPANKRRILELYAEHGYVYPETAIMAFHRGRFDLLAQHLARDPQLLSRQFAIGEIFPAEVGCDPRPYEAMGTPVDGGTLLHLAVYWDELDMAEWLLARGADPNARAAVDADGFGGHTALFGSVVSQAGFWINFSPRTSSPDPLHTHSPRASTRGSVRVARSLGRSRAADPKGPPKTGNARFTELLLARGADPNVRASIRMRLGEGHGDPRLREFRDVTPLAWGRRFSREQVPGKHREILFVNSEAMRVLEAHGGRE